MKLPIAEASLLFHAQGTQLEASEEHRTELGDMQVHTPQAATFHISVSPMKTVELGSGFYNSHCHSLFLRGKKAGLH